MLNFVCVNAQNYMGRGKQYVEILHDMVLRNLKAGTEGKFICFTDDQDKYAPGIEKRPLHGGLNGWWNKLYLFKDGLFNEGDRIVFFDLDTVIVSGLDDIIKYEGNFAILKDFYRPDGLQSSVMMWKAGWHTSHIWDQYNGLGYPILNGGDQTFIERAYPHADILQDLYPDCFVSYKISAQSGIPKNAKIVVFHGNPRPHAAGGWVDKVWKIGGGGSLEMDMICNVSSEQLENNIRYCMSLNHMEINSINPPNEIKAIFVGGGPSLANQALLIDQMQKEGGVVFALNGAYKWLRERRIPVKYHIIADARPENADFIDPDPFTTYLIASHCDKAVFDKLKMCDVIIWHRGHEGMRDIVNPGFTKKDAYMAGGSTVGLVGLSVAYALGFTGFHLFGYDSSYAGDAGHAYEQLLNDNERIIEIDFHDRVFRCAPWMIQQVNEYVDFAPVLIGLGCQITVYGDGALPYINRCMIENAEPETEIVKKDGTYWPKNDTECRQSIEHFIDDAQWIMGFCKGFSIAIQAGGNVGIWPKKMAEKFNTVYTFEPDNINFQCLVRNCSEPNIVKIQAGLGDKHSLIGLATQRHNCGAHCVDGEGIYPIFRIDDLALKSCDLIQLDIEGFEGFAIQGAIETIKAFKPVICLELKGLGDKYDMPDDDVIKLLDGLGYKISSRKHRDVLFTYEGET